MKRILCSLLVATLPFGSVLASAPKSSKNLQSSTREGQHGQEHDLGEHADDSAARSGRARHAACGKTARPETGRSGQGPEPAHHPNISFGWGNATVSLQIKKIKGLHENDFIMATKIDHIFARTATVVSEL